MSETLKLIIEIPKEMMKAMEVGNFGSKYNPYDVCWQVKNGIPLDDVKAEIEKQIERDFAFSETETLKVPCHYGIANGLQNAIRFLDNIGKAESED